MFLTFSFVCLLLNFIGYVRLPFVGASYCEISFQTCVTASVSCQEDVRHKLSVVAKLQICICCSVNVMNH